MTDKTLNKVANMGKDSAVRNGWIFCRFYLHQPKTPGKLLEMMQQKKK